MYIALRGGSENSKFSQCQIFPKLGTRGGRQISNFSQIQKSPNHPRGQENCGLFLHFVRFFLMLPLGNRGLPLLVRGVSHTASPSRNKLV